MLLLPPPPAPPLPLSPPLPLPQDLLAALGVPRAFSTSQYLALLRDMRAGQQRRRQLGPPADGTQREAGAGEGEGEEEEVGKHTPHMHSPWPTPTIHAVFIRPPLSQPPNPKPHPPLP